MGYQQIKINLPHPVYAAPDPQLAADFGADHIAWIGPDHEISKATKVTVPQQDAANAGWITTVTPDELGLWNLQIGSDVLTTPANLGYSERFECVRSTDREIALGVQNAYQDGLVRVWPTTAISAAAAQVRHSYGSATGTKAFASRRAFVVPWDGYIYGLDIYTPATMDPTAVDSMKFFVMDPTANGSNKFVIRSISNDFKAATTWTAAAWNRVIFTKPVLARAGDNPGLAFTDDSGTDLPCWATYKVLAGQTGCQFISTCSAALDLTATGNTFAADFPGADDGCLPAIKLLMHPPAIAIAGHSFWGSGGGSCSIWEDSNRVAATVYTRANDLAALVQDRLGVPVVNCASGGSKITDWIGPTGYFEKIIATRTGSPDNTIHPAVMIFDSVYSDTDTYKTVSAYMAVLERLEAYCDQAGVELMFLESPVCDYANDGVKAPLVEWGNGVVATFCKLHGKRFIPLYYRTGAPSDANWAGRYRRIFKDFSAVDTTILDYGESGAVPVHLSASGWKAVAVAIVEAFRNRRMVEPRG